MIVMSVNISWLFALIKRIANSSLFCSAGIYTVTNAINSGIPFLMLPILTRYLTPRDYGIVAMFQVLIGIVAAFTGLGVQSAVTRQYFEKESLDFPNYITNCFHILCASALIIGLLLWLCSAKITQFTKFPGAYLWTVLAVSAGLFIVQMVLILWQVQVRPLAYGTFQILLTITNVGLSVWFIVGFGMAWQGRIQGQTMAFVIFAVLGCVILWKNGWLKWGYNGNYIRHALRFGVHLIPHTLGGIAISMTDRLLITNMIGVADTGIYVVGAQVGMIIGLLQDSFNRAWVPWLFGQLKKDNLDVKLKIVKITYAYNVLILVSALLLAIIAPWFLSFYVGKDFGESSKYVIWIALGYAFGGMYKMVTNYIFYVQKTHILALATFFTATVNILISYILIRFNGAVGAAQGTMCAYFLSFILTWIVSARVFEMPWNLKKA